MAVARYLPALVSGLAIPLLTASVVRASDYGTLQPGQVIEIPFSAAELPPTLYGRMHGLAYTPTLTVRLPDDYQAEASFPLLVYVPGNDGNRNGNMHNAVTLAGDRGWIATTVPLFKHSIDSSEPARGVIVSFEDYPVLAQAYATMLGRLFERVRNIDRERSAMVGFSNGAITIGVLVSNHDEFILTHFRNFCMVDNGMFHLMDLHKNRARDSRFLILVGDEEDFGRDLKLRQARLQQDSWQLLNVDVTFQILKDTGHVFREPEMAVVTDWLRTEVAPVSKLEGNRETPTP